MLSRRDFLSLLPASLAGASPFGATQESESGLTRFSLLPPRTVFRPLDKITVEGAGVGRLLPLDGDGEPYFDTQVSFPASFQAGGALGTHTLFLLGNGRNLTGHASFSLDARTDIRDQSGEYP